MRSTEAVWTKEGAEHERRSICGGRCPWGNHLTEEIIGKVGPREAAADFYRRSRGPRRKFESLFSAGEGTGVEVRCYLSEGQP